MPKAAFAVLEWPSMVRFGAGTVCRRALADPKDATGTRQATFLVLVRRAGSVRTGGLRSAAGSTE